MRTPEQRRRAARVSLVLWYGQIPVGAALSVAAVVGSTPWPSILLVYVTLLSVWTGIESAHARLNADLPTEADSLTPHKRRRRSRRGGVIEPLVPTEPPDA